MRILRNTIRYPQLVISLAYTCLYLFAPLFHHHPDAERQAAREDLHSHVLGDIANEDRDADGRHTLDQVNDHHLTGELEIVVISLSPRHTCSPTDETLPTRSFNFDPPQKVDVSEHTDDDPPADHRGREWILSASNASPPLD